MSRQSHSFPIVLVGANFEDADLRDVNLRGACLRGANLRECDLRGGNLEGADLEKADLRGSRLNRTHLIRAELWGADLRGARLEGAILEKANLSGADLSGSLLAGANLRGARFSAATRVDEGLWVQYLAEVVPELCTAGGRTLNEVATAWGRHDWRACPMHVAFGITSLEEAPPFYRPAIQRFVQFFDAGLIPNPATAPAESD